MPITEGPSDGNTVLFRSWEMRVQDDTEATPEAKNNEITHSGVNESEEQMWHGIAFRRCDPLILCDGFQIRSTGWHR